MLTEQNLFDEALHHILIGLSRPEHFATPYVYWQSQRAPPRKLCGTFTNNNERLLDSVMPCAYYFLSTDARNPLALRMGTSLATAFQEMAWRQRLVLGVDCLAARKSDQKAEALLTQLVWVTSPDQTVSSANEDY
ncbi:MAG: hypothetical protein M1836_002883 [Candelina mexicana]|nr:MAG: hypothetical protein M1836_002883 [Candelina mexicana]